MNNQAITFDDVLLIPCYNGFASRADPNIGSKDVTGKLSLPVPVISANMDTITESDMVRFMKKHGATGALHRFCSIEDNVKMFMKTFSADPESSDASLPTICSIGCNEKDYMDRVSALKDAGATHFCVDVAHAHSNVVGKTLKALRGTWGSQICIIAGNVATYAGADYLASCGADIIKVGIGGGSVCTTRIKTGFGVPMLTCIQNCSRVDRSIIADGGIRTPGDVAKALAFGADFVMIGSMLAGTAPTPGKVIQQGLGSKPQKCYRGMASQEAYTSMYGDMPVYKTSEGVSTYVPFRQDQDAIMLDIIGGLRSALTYAGAANIKNFQNKLDYIVVSNASRVESLPHRLLS